MHSAVLSKFGLSDTNHQRARHTGSNRSQISQAQACQTYPETLKPQLRLKCYLYHNFLLLDELFKVNSALKSIFSMIKNQCSGGHYEVQSEEDGTSKQAHVNLVNKQRNGFQFCFKPILDNFKIFIGSRDHYR